MRWLLLFLPGGFLIMLVVEVRRWRTERQNRPTRFEDTRAMVGRPVIIDGQERQPQLRRIFA